MVLTHHIMPTPEELARENIDKQLIACGWTVQSRVETFFRDERDPEPRSRRAFTFNIALPTMVASSPSCITSSICRTTCSIRSAKYTSLPPQVSFDRQNAISGTGCCQRNNPRRPCPHLHLAHTCPGCKCRGVQVTGACCFSILLPLLLRQGGYPGLS